MSAIGFNSGGNEVFASAKVKDATGAVETVAAAGTPVPLIDPLFAADVDDGSDGVAFTVANGRFAVDAAKGGLGVYELTASLPDVIGANSAIVYAGFHKNGTAIGARARGIMASTAARINLGVARAIVALSADGDYVDLRVDSNTNADTVTVRECHVLVRKISSLV